MDRNQFIADVFRDMYAIFIDELLEYDEAAGEKRPKVSDVYLQALNMASKAAQDASTLLDSIIEPE